MTSHADSIPAAIRALLARCAALARESGSFESVDVQGLLLHATDSIQPDAAFRITFEDGKLWAAWVSANRYLSQSIEADVKWTGDDIDELIDEEVEAQGWTGAKIGRFEHFRSEDRLYTFRSALPIDPAKADQPAAKDAVLFLLAYQAAFRNLGDMKPEED
jgi:hypothetical protein